MMQCLKGTSVKNQKLRRKNKLAIKSVETVRRRVGRSKKARRGNTI